MTTPFKKNHLTKAFIGMAVLLTAFTYSCNDSAPKEEKTETVTPAPTDSMMKMSTDTTMKMHADTTKTDTSGKGSQPAPPRN